MSQIKDKYNEVAQQYNTKVQVYMEQCQELVNELIQATNRLNEVIVNEVENGSTKASQAEIVKLTKRIDEIKNTELPSMDVRIKAVNDMKDKVLREKFAGLVAERDAAVDNARNSIVKGSKELLEKRAEILLQLQELFRIGNDAKDQHRDIVAIAKELGIEYHGRCELPGLPLNPSGRGVHEHLLPSHVEITDAYRSGKVPYFVEMWEKTGVWMTNDDARRKLAEMAKAEADKEGDK